MRRIKWLIGVFSFACLSLLAIGCGEEEKSDGQAFEPLDTSGVDVIATYDGVTSGEVTEGEFHRFLNVMAFVNPQIALVLNEPEFKDELLRQYIAQTSIAAEVAMTDDMRAEADEWMTFIEEQFRAAAEDEEEFAAHLADAGFTEEDLHDFFTGNQKIQAYFNAQISDADVEKGYEEMKESKDLRLYTAKIRHILIQADEDRSEDEALERAKEVKQKLKADGDFAAIAEEYSDDPGSKEEGGSLGEEPIPLATDTGPGLDPSFAEAARDLPVGEISDPVKSQFGYHIIKVEARERLSLNEAEDIVRADMIDKKYQEYVESELKIDTQA